MKRILFIFALLWSMTAFASTTERYQVSTDCINARRYPNTSAPVLFKYKNGEVVAICEYKTAGNYTWGRIAGANPPQWVAMNYLEKLPDLPKKESKVASRFSWAHFNPQLADKPYYVRLYWLTLLMAIYSLIWFIAFFNEAKSRGVQGEHIMHGVCGLCLWFWVFAFGTWQWMLPGFLYGCLFYPIAFSKNRASGFVSIMLLITSLAVLYFTYKFMQDWISTVMEVGFFSWLFTLILTGVDLVIALLIGTAYNTCSECDYYCKQKQVRSEYLGSTDRYDTLTQYGYDHCDINEKDRVITEYYRPHVTTDHYRVDHYKNTYYCPHCKQTYTFNSHIDNFISRDRRNIR